MRPEFDFRGRCLAGGILLCAILLCLNVTQTVAAPAAALPPGWQEVDQRLVFLTVQLSTIESSIDATDKALRSNGYEKLAREADAERDRKKNNAMDQQGGGPVRWQEFYGQTAESFFYHPTDGNTIHINPDAVAQRPPQFDYIYRANEQNREKAEDDAAKVGNKIDDLLTYRRELETEQSALWCKIAFRGVSSLALSEQPLYRLDLAGPAGDAGRQSVYAATAAVAFMKTIDTELTAAQKELDDQKGALDQLLAVTTAARSELQGKLLKLPAFINVLSDPKDPLGKFALLAKRLEDSAQNLDDAYRLAAECDAKDDFTAKRSYRRQMQEMAIGYATTAASAHAALSDAAKTWHVTPVVKSADPVAVKPPDADSISAKLDAAKITCATEQTTARRGLVSVVDDRLNAAADAGDLNGVQSLQSAKVKAATEGTVDDSITDPAIVAAKKTMDLSIAQSKAKLAAAYKEAISNFTKARKFPEAMAVQQEFKSAGLDTVDASVTPSPTGPLISGDTGDTAPVTGDGLSEPKFSGDTMTAHLAAPADDVVTGGGGRYLILHIKKLRQLAVFDISAGKVVKYIDLPDDKIDYAASQDKLVIGTRESGALQFWSLKSMTKTAATPGIGANIKAMAMGYASHGPLMIVRSKTGYLLNPDSPSHVEEAQWNPPYDGAPETINMSADGHTVVGYNFPGWAGSRCMVLNGLEVVSRHDGGYIHYNDLLLPPDGSRIFDSMDKGKIFSPDYKNETALEDLPSFGFPSNDSSYFIAYTDKTAKNNRRGAGEKAKLVICGVADRRPIITLDSLPELEGSAPVKHYQRVHFIPAVNLLVTIGEDGDNIVLRKLDIYKTLADQGIDYLVITSSPPGTIGKGRSLNYQMAVKSLKGNVKYTLESGPDGMTLSPGGLLHWSAPSRSAEESVSVIIDVSDDSKQEVFQNFKLNLVDAHAAGLEK